MKKLFLLAIFLVTVSALTLHAQEFDLSKNPQSVISLDGLWRFHPGDDMRWSDPAFDDSAWPTLRSDKDWSTQGYRYMSGYGWYRFVVDIPAGLDSISLRLPVFAGSYEVYANGTLIGMHGALPPNWVTTSGGQGQTFRLPPAARKQQKVEIAIRVWLWLTYSRIYGGGPRTGGSLIGATGAIGRLEELQISSALFHFTPAMLVALLEILAAAGALLLYLKRRSEREYFWFGILMLSGAAYAIFVVCQEFIPISGNTADFIRVSLLFAVFPLAELYFYLHLLKAQRTRWFKLALVCAVLNVAVGLAFLRRDYGPYVHFDLQVLITLLAIPQYVWVLALLFKRARANFMDAQWLLVPAVFQKLALIWNRYGSMSHNYGSEHRYGYLTQIITEPVRVDLMQMANAFFVLAVFAILSFRFARTSSREERYASEVEAAREVQQYLIPVQLPETPGLAIQSVYLPSREVGGDFFQVLPDARDGSVLIVVGDVAGKGLQAGMLATLIVGAIRVAAQFTTEPARILALLNERLQGRGLVTCLALKIAADGRTTLANAGHLPPYRTGREIEIDGALPLGAIPGVEYASTEFRLDEGDTLVLMSDGIAEAQDTAGRLFGFQRIEQMLCDNATAESLAAAAQAFGQEDDITVLTLTLASFKAGHA
jgi:hypothetical protein